MLAKLSCPYCPAGLPGFWEAMGMALQCCSLPQSSCFATSASHKELCGRCCAHRRRRPLRLCAWGECTRCPLQYLLPQTHAILPMEEHLPDYTVPSASQGAATNGYAAGPAMCLTGPRSSSSDVPHGVSTCSGLPNALRLSHARCIAKEP